MLEVARLSAVYGKHRALDGVSLDVERGEIVVILGANGAGKTTLLKAIAGLVPAAGRRARARSSGRDARRHVRRTNRRGRHRAGAGRPRHLRRTDGARKPAARRLCQPRARRSEAENLDMVLSCSRGLPSAARRPCAP